MIMKALGRFVIIQTCMAALKTHYFTSKLKNYELLSSIYSIYHLDFLNASGPSKGTFGGIGYVLMYLRSILDLCLTPFCYLNFGGFI